jgi:hypothetical protein
MELNFTNENCNRNVNKSEVIINSDIDSYNAFENCVDDIENKTFNSKCHKNPILFQSVSSTLSTCSSGKSYEEEVKKLNIEKNRENNDLQGIINKTKKNVFQMETINKTSVVPNYPSFYLLNKRRCNTWESVDNEVEKIFEDGIKEVTESEMDKKIIEDRKEQEDEIKRELRHLKTTKNKEFILKPKKECCEGNFLSCNENKNCNVKITSKDSGKRYRQKSNKENGYAFYCALLFFNFCLFSFLDDSKKRNLLKAPHLSCEPFISDNNGVNSDSTVKQKKINILDGNIKDDDFGEKTKNENFGGKKIEVMEPISNTTPKLKREKIKIEKEEFNENDSLNDVFFTQVRLDPKTGRLIDKMRLISSEDVKRETVFLNSKKNNDHHLKNETSCTIPLNFVEENVDKTFNTVLTPGTNCSSNNNLFHSSCKIGDKCFSGSSCALDGKPVSVMNCSYEYDSFFFFC